MSSTVETIDILGVGIARLSAEQALGEVEKLFASGRPAFIAHTNAHTLNLAYEDPGYKEVLRRADLVLNDGKGVMIAARIHGDAFPTDLNGNYFTPLLLQRAAERGWRVYFLGAGPGVAERAAEKVRGSVPGISIVGARDGYFSSDEEVIAAIKETEAELLFVAMGNPLQERWLDRCIARTGARVGVGVGATFDFLAGGMPRAPAWMRRVGLEWVYRLFREPKRLWRRYILGNPSFLLRNLKQRRAVRTRAIE